MITTTTAISGEIEEFAAEVERFLAGGTDEDTFRKLRLRFGIYGQRQPGVQMVRVKIPAGTLTPPQLHRLADLATEFGRGVGHITTRQDLQIHFVAPARVPELLARLAEVGLTTREACGNAVRNVACCPLAGVNPREAFDVTPHARAVARHFLRHLDFQELPRKFKVSFCGERGECGGAGFDDIGALATLRDGRRGFRLYVGGGLGNTPRGATLLEDFTPEEELLRTCEAILRVFDARGERKNRNRARIKFLIERLGWERFHSLVLAERARLPAIPLRLDPEERPPSPVEIEQGPEPADPAYFRWKRTNVTPQKQDGFAVVQVLVPIGDLLAPQMHALARLGATHADGRIRFTRSQNVVLRWVRVESLPAVWRQLREIRLAGPGAEGIADVTACPGAATCSLAFTTSAALAGAIRQEIAGRPELYALAESLKVRISGCPNSCGQHQVADIGFHGAQKAVGGRYLPAYEVLVGGGVSDGRADFGVSIGRVPARSAPAAFRRIVELYAAERRPGEEFLPFARRVGAARFEALVRPLEEVSDVAPHLRDWGRTEEFVPVRSAKGECAA